MRLPLVVDCRQVYVESESESSLAETGEKPEDKKKGASPVAGPPGQAAGEQPAQGNCCACQPVCEAPEPACVALSQPEGAYQCKVIEKDNERNTFIITLTTSNEVVRDVPAANLSPRGATIQQQADGSVELKNSPVVGMIGSRVGDRRVLELTQDTLDKGEDCYYKPDK